MKASELRIGNLVSSNVNIRPLLEIRQIFSDSYQALGRDGKGHGVYNYSSCEGIPLTEEWLLKFGFELNEGGSYFIKSKIAITKNYIRDGSGRYDGFYCVLGFIFPEKVYLKLEYVHQLQNLYFAITNEELTIKS